jgi:hypothetical protein
MDKRVPKIMLPIKPPKISYMTHEENEDIHNQLSNLENQFKELSDKGNVPLLFDYT